MFDPSEATQSAVFYSGGHEENVEIINLISGDVLMLQVAMSGHGSPVYQDAHSD